MGDYLERINKMEFLILGIFIGFIFRTPKSKKSNYLGIGSNKPPKSHSPGHPGQQNAEIVENK